VHAAKTKQPLKVQQKRDTPITVETFECQFDAKAMGMKFKKEAGAIKEFVMGLERDKLECIKKELAEKG
jgi:glycyl-tRNA synthetase